MKQYLEQEHEYFWKLSKLRVQNIRELQAEYRAHFEANDTPTSPIPPRNLSPTDRTSRFGETRQLEKQVTNLATDASGSIAPRWVMVLTAVKRHAPQQTCPQGVRVAFVGGKKQMGQEYADNGSGSSRGGEGRGEGRERCSLEPDAMVNSVGESMMMGIREGVEEREAFNIDPGATVTSVGDIRERLGDFSG
jgi:hypothetical protein